MQLYYEGKNITDDVTLAEAVAEEFEGGVADEIAVALTDTESLWPKWSPARFDKMRIKCDAYDSGEMYLDDIATNESSCLLRAGSIPPQARTAHFKTWEGVTLKAVIGDIAKRYGLTPSLHDVPNVSYPRIEQRGQCDLAWLSDRCVLEGCQLKIYGGKLVIYDVAKMEARKPVKTIAIDAAMPYRYRDTSHVLRSSCVVDCGSFRGRYEQRFGVGPAMRVTSVEVHSVAEAERYARGLLRAQNQNACTLTFETDLSGDYAAGEVIEITGNPLVAGNWFASSVRNDFFAERTRMTLRRCMAW